MINTYILTTKEYNTHNQEALTEIAFLANDLNHLDSLMEEYQNGSDWPNKEILEFKSNVPENFYDAGGFFSEDISFVCKETGEDISDWYKTQGWGIIKK